MRSPAGWPGRSRRLAAGRAPPARPVGRYHSWSRAVRNLVACNCIRAAGEQQRGGQPAAALSVAEAVVKGTLTDERTDLSATTDRVLPSLDANLLPLTVRHSLPTWSFSLTT